MRLCLDTNCLRDVTLMTTAMAEVEAEGGHLMIPDTVVAEMIKSADWRSTMRSSLRHLRAHASRVIAADSMGARMQQERATGCVSPDLHDDGLTDDLRGFLIHLDRDESAALERIATQVACTTPTVVSRAQSAISLHPNNLEAITRWKEFLTSDAVRRLRHLDYGVITDLLKTEFVNDVCRGMLASAGYDEHVARKMAGTDSVSRRCVLAHEASVLRWLAKGGLDTRKAQQIANDYFDLEVVVVGTYCTRNLAKDTVVRELDAVLRPILPSR